MFLRLALTVVTASLLVVLPLHAESAEETARQFLILAHDGRFGELSWGDDAAGKELFERTLRHTLRVRCVRVEGIAVRSRAIGDESATLEVEIALHKSDTKTPGIWMPLVITPLRVELLRRGERWVVSAIRFPDEEFADQLLAAPVEDRGRMLRENASRISKGLGRAIYARSITFANSSRVAEARPAALLAREVAILTGDRGGEALAIGMEGWVARLSDEGEASIRFSRESLAIIESIAPDPDLLARAWYNLGRSIQHANQWREDIDGDVASSIEDSWLRALEFAERAEDPTLKSRAVDVLSRFSFNKADYFNARRLNELAPAEWRAGDPAGEMSYEMQNADIYFDQGDRDLGLFHMLRALKLGESHNSLFTPYLLIRIGAALRQEGRLAEAREVLTRALPRNDRGEIVIDARMNRSRAAHALEEIAALEAEDGRLEEAECLFREGDAILSGPDTPHPRRAYFLLSPYFAQRGDHLSALRVSLQSVGKLTPVETVRALTAAARAYRALGNRDRSMALISEAIAMRESHDARIAGGEEQRVRSADWIAGCYELAAELALDRGDILDALAFVERGRGRVLTDIVENGRPTANAEVSEAELQTRTRHEQALVRLNIELDRAQAAQDHAVVAALNDRVHETRREFQSYVDGLRVRSELRMARRRQVDRASIEDALSRLPEAMTVVEYVVGDDQLHAFVMRKDAAGKVRVSLRTTTVARKMLEERAQAFVEMLAQRHLGFRHAGMDLYSLLVAPIERELAGATTLLVIPDEVLWRVPFGALIDSRGEYLVERAAVVYASSISVYAMMSERRENDRRSLPSTVLAVANPTLDTASQQAFRSFYRSASLGSIPHAEIEADALCRLYDREHCLVLKRNEATEGRTKSEIRGAGIVHFATHGLLDDRNPMYSRLALARGADIAEDGWLEAWEIARMNVDADLVVLSACDTARGRIGGGEGVLGMTWSFFVAGARTMLATQWKVESESTAQLMIAFHSALRADHTAKPMQKARALREAQLRILQNERFDHPFYWAAFVLIGDAS